MNLYNIFSAAFQRVGGYNELVTQYFTAMPSKLVFDQNNQTCGLPPYYALNFFRPIWPGESDLPWTGVIFGLTIGSIWYWCTDQVNLRLKYFLYYIFSFNFY